MRKIIKFILIIFLYHLLLLIGIKGRIQSRVFEDGENNKKYTTEVVAEKVTFLSSGKK